MPTIGCQGYHHDCNPEKKQELIDRVKKRNALKRDSGSIRKLIKPDIKIVGSAELNRWFNERRKELDGKCKHCGNPSCKNDEKYFKFSICHILPKAYFPSVATHPKNFIELCFWGNNCHGNMDNKMLDLTEMNCWDEIVTKFCQMYPIIDAKEKKRIPKMLLQYMEVEK